MLKKLVFAALIAGSFAAHAETGATSNEVRLMVGGKNLATAVGLEYERRMGNQGWSVFGYQSKKRDMVGMIPANPEQWILGVGAPIHLQDRTDFDVYITPAITLINQKDVITDPVNNPTNKENVFTAGPTLKIGTLYSIANVVNVGAEYVFVTNWFSDKMAGSQEMANFTLGYRF